MMVTFPVCSPIRKLYWLGLHIVPMNSISECYSIGWFQATYKLVYSDGHTSGELYKTLPIQSTTRYEDYRDIQA